MYQFILRNQISKYICERFRKHGDKVIICFYSRAFVFPRGWWKNVHKTFHGNNNFLENWSNELRFIDWISFYCLEYCRRHVSRCCYLQIWRLPCINNTLVIKRGSPDLVFTKEVIGTEGTWK